HVFAPIAVALRAPNSWSELPDTNAKNAVSGIADKNCSASGYNSVLFGKNKVPSPSTKYPTGSAAGTSTADRSLTLIFTRLIFVILYHIRILLYTFIAS